MRRTLFAIALAAPLLASPAPLLDSLRAFLATVWSGASVDAGCGMDPNGGCAPAPRETLDEGCGADPNGRCAPAPQPDAGCGMDPDGCPQGS